MQPDRGIRLLAALALSMGIHAVVGLTSRTFVQDRPITRVPEIEIAIAKGEPPRDISAEQEATPLGPPAPLPVYGPSAPPSRTPLFNPGPEWNMPPQPGNPTSLETGKSAAGPGPGSPDLSFDAARAGATSAMPEGTDAPGRRLDTEIKGGRRMAPLRHGIPFGPRSGVEGEAGQDLPVTVVYVVDVSGSMAEEGKLPRAIAAIQAALRRLTPMDSFDLVAFTASARTFSEQPVPATPGNVDQACAWLDQHRSGNLSSVVAGLEAAFALPGVTNVALVWDGDIEGSLDTPEEIRRKARRLGARRAAITTVAIGTGNPPEGAEVMQQMAADSGGDYLWIDLSGPSETEAP